MYEYRCKIVKIIDGDTVDVDIDLGFNAWIHNERVRLDGVDTPESRTSDKIEKFFGLLVKQQLEQILPVGSSQILQTTSVSSTEKFGRTLGFFKLNDSSVNNWLIENSYAVAYQGQNKELVQASHKSNYSTLLSREPDLKIQLLTEAKIDEVKITEYLK